MSGVVRIFAGDEITLGFTTQIELGAPNGLYFAVEHEGTTQFQKALGSGVTVDGANHFTVQLSASDTSGLLGNYQMQGLLLEEGTGLQRTIALGSGNFIVDRRLEFTI